MNPLARSQRPIRLAALAHPALLLALSGPSALAAPAEAPPITEDTLVVPEDGRAPVPTNARLFLERGTGASLSVDGGGFAAPTWPESDPHPGFDGATLEGLKPSSSQVIELQGEVGGSRVIHIETGEGEDHIPPILEGEVAIEQRRTLWGDDIIAIVPASLDEQSYVAAIGVFAAGGGSRGLALYQSIIGAGASDSHELRVPSVVEGEVYGVQVVVVDGAGNEAATEVMNVTAGEGAGCSSAGPVSGPAPLLGLGLLLLARRRSRS